MDANVRNVLMEGGINFDEVLERCMGSEALVARLLKKFPADGSFARLSEAVAGGNEAAALEASHTLKGVAQHLGMDRLYKPAATLCDAVRGPKPLEDASLWPPVVAAHEEVLAAIREL